MLQRIGDFLRRQAIGRNGPDQLGLAATFAGLAAGVLEILFPSGLFMLVQLALFVYACFRMWSRNVNRRRDENAKFMYFVMPKVTAVKQFFLRIKGMRTYKYFRCPKCGVRMRLKRGGGEKTVRCPKCQESFKQKS